MEQLIVRKLEDWETFFLGLNKLQKEHKEVEKEDENLLKRIIKFNRGITN